MKFLFALIFALISLCSVAQNEPPSKAVFHSVVTHEETVNDFQLESDYYPLKSNIDDSNSVIFISANPTLDQIENTAVNVVSDFFYLSKNGKRLLKIMLINKPKRTYFIGDVQTGDQNEIECDLKGDITENRANEIVREMNDTAAQIKDGKLFFNNKEFAIIPAKEIQQDVINLVSKYRLFDKPVPAKNSATPPPKKTTTTKVVPKK